MANYDYELNAKPKMTQEERDEKMKKFLEKGGKIQKLTPGSAYNLGCLDRSGKPAFSNEEIKKGIGGKTAMPDYDNHKPNTYHDFDLGGDNKPVFHPNSLKTNK